MNVSRDTTIKLKGIAILLMIYHHLFGFPERLLPGISYREIYVGKIALQMEIAIAAKLCVSIYAIITGYGLAKKDRITWRYIWQKILPILCAYWISLLIFTVFYLTAGVSVKVFQIIMNIFIIATDINHSTWYLNFYILAFVSIKLFKEIFERYPGIEYLILLLFWAANGVIDHMDIVNLHIMHYFHYMPVVIIGYMMGRSISLGKFLTKLLNSKGSALLVSAGIGICIIARKVTGSSVCSLKTLWVFTPILFICFIVLIEKISVLSWFGNFLRWCGKYSTEFWLLNAIFTSGILWIQKIVFFPKISVIILAWAIVLMYPFGYIMKAANNKICSRKEESKEK